MPLDLWFLLWVLAAAIGIVLVLRLTGASPLVGPEAVRRAEQLLRETLSADEYQTLERRGFLEVPSRLVPDRVYRIRRRGPVEVHEGGRLLTLLCLRPLVYLPEPDLVVLHKVLLEGDEQRYVRTANRLAPRPAALFEN